MVAERNSSSFYARDEPLFIITVIISVNIITICI